jgi:hypothetical protein
MQEDQVNVRYIVKFTAAQLPHTQHNERGSAPQPAPHALFLIPPFGMCR